MPRRLTIKDAKKIATNLGGKCLSKEYINSHTKLNWKCQDNHEFYTSISDVKSGHWCRKCFDNSHKLNLCIAQELAINKGGLCLSNEYINSNTNMLWQCQFGHKWLARLSGIRRNWCRECIKVGIEKAQELAKSRNGKCLSKKYENNKCNLEWSCEYGHIWKARFDNIKHGTWCPFCKIWKTQEKIKNIFETILKIKSISNFKGFNWLINSETNRRLEIDIWFPSLKLAIEYNGEYHYYPIINSDLLNKQKARDKLKIKLIKKHSDDIKYFIKISCKEKLDEKLIYKKLERLGLLYGVNR